MKTDFKDSARRLLDPVVDLLARLNVTPDQVTLTGLLLSFGAAACLAVDRYPAAAVLLLVGSVCDALDGGLARKTGRGSRFGAFFDSTLDRYAEAAIFMGLAISYARTGQVLLVGVAFAAGMGSLLVSYARARAEGLGIECKVGLMERPERLGVLILGAAAGPLLMVWAVWLLAGLTHITALQRIAHVHRVLRSEER